MFEERASGSFAGGRARTEERIDSHDHPIADFERTYRDLRWVNRWLGGTSVILRHVLPMLPASGEVRVLDVGVGSGDIPIALVERARRRGVTMRVTAIDTNPKVVEIGRRFTAAHPEIEVLLADGGELAYPDRAFDFAISSLTFHHFDDATAVRVLREMTRVASRAVVVNDLRRGRLPAALIWGVTHALRMHPLTRHDAPLSVMRAFTPQEYRALAQTAGVNGEVHMYPFWRAALVVRR